jgi:hyperosmotically inducible protein
MRKLLSSLALLGSLAVPAAAWAETGTMQKDADETSKDAKRVADQSAKDVKDAADTAARDVKEAADKAGNNLSDTWITTHIKEQFVADELVRGRDIHVTTKNHHVWLKGTVQSVEARDRALSIARSTKGAWDVDERLRIVPDA